jgi:hypothetical protein
VATPMDFNVQFQLANEVLTMRDMIFIIWKWWVASCLFVILGPYSDLAFVIGIVAKFSSGPKHVHCNVVLRILKYLKATMHYKLCYYGGNNNRTPTAFVNAKYKSDLDERKSDSSCLVFSTTYR